MNGYLSVKTVFLVAAVLTLQNCTMTEDPEMSGGEIIAVPETLSCEFNLSQDGRWLQHLGDSSPYFENEDPPMAILQRRPLLVNIETGESHIPEPDEEVKEMIKKGLGPSDLGCFSPDQETVYISQTVLSQGETIRTQQSDAAETGSRTRLSVPTRPIDTYFYAIDLTKTPLTIVKTTQKQCAAKDQPKRPDIRIEQTSDKEIRIYSVDGRLLATHHPHGLPGSSISAFDPNSDYWHHSFVPSPSGNKIAYFINETGVAGFASPTRGYWLNLSSEEQAQENFLAASAYSFQWGDDETLYACTSHSEQTRVIARWKL